MKKSDSQLRLTWKFSLALSIPVEHRHVAPVVRRVLIAACAATLTLGLVPLAAMLLAGS